MLDDILLLLLMLFIGRTNFCCCYSYFTLDAVVVSTVHCYLFVECLFIVNSTISVRLPNVYSQINTYTWFEFSYVLRINTAALAVALGCILKTTSYTNTIPEFGMMKICLISKCNETLLIRLCFGFLSYVMVDVRSQQHQNTKALNVEPLSWMLREL